MRKYIYLFFIFWSFPSAFSQSATSRDLILQTETEIDQKLEAMKKNPIADQKQKERILLQLKTKSEELGHIPGILMSGTDLMRLYGGQSRNKETIELGNQLKKIAQNRKDTNGTISSIYRYNALSLGMLGLDEASFRDFKVAIKSAEDIENNDSKQYILSLCYGNIAGYYNSKQFKNKIYRDSIKYYINKSLETSNNIKNDNGAVSNQLKYDNIAFGNMRLGIFYLEQPDTKGSLELAEKHLMDALKIYENDASNILPDNRTMLMNQLSWLYEEKEDYQKSIDYANRALVLEKLHPDPYHRVESYEFLASSYLEMGEEEKSKSYMAKYTYLKDSINMINRSAADATMTKMVAQEAENHNVGRRKLLIWIVVIFLLIVLATFFVWKIKDRIMRNNYEQIIDKLKPEENKQEIEISDDNIHIVTEVTEEPDLASAKTILSIETEARILKRLLTFENLEKFLKKDISLTTLAHQKNTNPRYLSEVIRIHKKQNFNGYINSLRVNYIIQKLYNEPKYREYKISYLAEECGYTSSQVFVIAFKKETGVTPSYFIDNLKNDQLDIVII